MAMFLGGSFQYPTHARSLLPKEEMAKWEVSEIPGMKPGQTATGTGGWTMGAFTEDPEKVEACVSILKEIYIGKGNELVGELPTQQKLFSSLKTFQEPVFKTFRKYLEKGQARPGLPVYPAMSSELQVAIGSVITGLGDAGGGAEDRGRPHRPGLRAADRGAGRMTAVGTRVSGREATRRAHRRPGVAPARVDLVAGAAARAGHACSSCGRYSTCCGSR